MKTMGNYKKIFDGLIISQVSITGQCSFKNKNLINKNNTTEYKVQQNKEYNGQTKLWCI